MTRRRGLTLVEMLLALAIVAMLLAAVAVAMNGSFISMRENDRILAMAQTARWNLSRIVADIRTADSLTTTTSSLTTVPPTNDDELTQIHYLVSGGALVCQRTVGGVVTAQVLLSADGPVQIHSLMVSKKVVDTVTRSVTVTLELEQAGRVYSFTASASPRRNQGD